MGFVIALYSFSFDFAEHHHFDSLHKGNIGWNQSKKDKNEMVKIFKKLIFLYHKNRGFKCSNNMLGFRTLSQKKLAVFIGK